MLKRKTVTDRLQASRSVKSDAIRREMMLVSIASRMPGWDAHLCDPLQKQVNFPKVVCLHSPAGDLTWRVHTDELPLFDHLENKPNHGSKGRSDKEVLLMMLGVEGW